MNSLLPNNEKQVHHKFGQFRRGVIIGEQREVMLTKHTKAVHPHIIYQEEHFGHGLGNLLLQLLYNLKYVIVAKDGIHPDHNLPYNDEDVFLYVDVD